MIEIKKNSESFDLFDNTRVALTYQATNFLELTALKASFSQSIDLPMTPKNCRLLGFPEVFHSVSAQHYAPITDIIVFSDGIELFKGAGKLNQVTEAAINIEFVFGNGGFLESIKNQSLNDLDFSAFTHPFPTAVQVNGAQNNTWEDVYIYLILQNGQLHAPKQMKTEYLKPFIFVRPIFSKIFEAAGYTLEGSFDINLLNNFVISSPSGDPFEAQRAQIKASTDLKVFNSVLQNVYALATLQGVVYAYKPLFDRVLLGNGFSDSNKYTVPQTGLYKVKFDCILRTVRNDLEGDIAIIGVNINGEYYGNSVPGINPNAKAKSLIVTEQANQVYKIEFEQQFNTGDYLEPFLVVAKPLNPPPGFIDPVVEFLPNSVFLVEYQPTQNQFDWVISPNLPPIKQVDFLREFIVRYNLILQEDPYNKIVRLDYLKDIDITEAIDITHAVDFTKKVWEYRDESLAQNNWLRYKPTDLPSDIDGFFSVFDSTLPPIQDVYTSLFANINNDDSQQIVITNEYELSSDDVSLEFAQYQKKDIGVYVLEVLPYNPTVSPIYTDIDYVFLFDSYSFVPAEFARRRTKFGANLSFGALIQNYWSFTTRLFSQYKRIEVYANLDPLFVQNLDFTRLVYIGGEYNSLFFLNKIDQYTPTQPTRLELIKV